jgi:hypothetical protein
MTAEIIDGRALAKTVIAAVKAQLPALPRMPATSM